jgi:acyl-CoA reductase-like NAD-dependent aldehyde dehydrogenase
MIRTISPVDGHVVLETKCDSEEDITAIVNRAVASFKKNRATPLKKRIEIATRFLDLLLENKDSLVRAFEMEFIIGS